MTALGRLLKPSIRRGGSDHCSFGGVVDAAVRQLPRLKPLLKVPLVITNMPGGGATKGMLYVSQQPADGYMILAATTSHLIDAVKPKTRSHFLRDFDPLLRVQWDTTAVLISGESKFKTLGDLIDYGKKNPKMLKFAGTSPGGWSEIQTVAFFKKAGVEVTFVPFDSGAEIKAAILGGHIHGAMEELAETLPLVGPQTEGPGCSDGKEAPTVPDVPTPSNWGLTTPWIDEAWAVKGTPEGCISTISQKGARLTGL
jgi:tripartite-type tricarboxylate transporter receptor subunit TctC